MWWLTKTDHDLCGSARHAFAATQIERHTLPSPVVNVQFQCGKGRGLAVHRSFRSVVGAVLDVSVDEDKTVTLEKAIMVCDCGTVINPKLVEAQMQGGFIFGLTAAAFGEITVEQGKVTQGNFDEYEMLKLASAPKVEVHILPSDDLPGGVGEPGTPPAAPALANAIFAATGERVRTLPIVKSGFSIAGA